MPHQKNAVYGMDAQCNQELLGRTLCGSGRSVDGIKVARSIFLFHAGRNMGQRVINVQIDSSTVMECSQSASVVSDVVAIVLSSSAGLYLSIE